MLMHKKSDRIAIEFTMSDDDKVTAYFCPLTVGEKSQIIASVPQNQNDPMAVLEFSKQVIKTTLKDIKGLENYDGSRYELTFENGKVSDECLDEIMNIPELFQKTMTVASMFLSGVPKEGQIINPHTGQVIEGISVKKRQKMS